MDDEHEQPTLKTRGIFAEQVPGILEPFRNRTPSPTLWRLQTSPLRTHIKILPFIGLASIGISSDN